MKNLLPKQPPEMFCEKIVTRNFRKFTENHLWQSLRFEVSNFIKKETLAQVFPFDFSEIL